ncbi:MAG: TonB-dependent receptor, partial [Halieaceae bacterium]
VSQNARFGVFEDNVERDESGNLALVQANNINIGKRRVRGADLSMTYHLPKQHWGQLTFTGNAAYIDEYLASLDPSAPELDLAGTFRDEASEGLGGIPQWKAQLGARWKHKRWRGSYDLHYVSTMEEVIPGTELFRDIDSWLVHDLQLSYTFNVLQGLRASLGVDNLFDEEAPLAASAFNDNIDGRTHELKGRYWYTKLSQRF